MPDKLSIEEILQTEFSRTYADHVLSLCEELDADKTKRFIWLCENAMVISFRKYGLVAVGYSGNGTVLALECIEQRLERYEKGGWRGDVEIKPGNTEWLVDVFNFVMIESMFPRTKDNGELVCIKPEEFDRPGQIRDEIIGFRRDGQYNRLVAIGELALREFCDPKQKNAYYEGTDNASPGRIAIDSFDKETFVTEHKNDILQD